MNVFVKKNYVMFFLAIYSDLFYKFANKVCVLCLLPFDIITTVFYAG